MRKLRVVLIGAQGKLGSALYERYSAAASVLAVDLKCSGGADYQALVRDSLARISEFGPCSVDLVLFAHRAVSQIKDKSSLGLGDLQACNAEINTIILMIDGLIQKNALKKGAKIILFGSTNSERISQQNLQYHISKGSIKILVAWFAERLASRGIVVNGVSMGLLVSKREDEKDGNSLLKKVASKSNIDGRPTYFEDVVELVYAIASLRTNQLTGQVITIDGGFSLSDLYSFTSRVNEI